MKVIYQVSAGGIVYKKIGETILWLITQHSQHKGWVFPKGLVGDHAKDEPMEEAALREVEEEGGVKAKIVDKKPVIVSYKYKWPSSAKASAGKENSLINKTVYYYLMEYVSGDPKNHDWEMMDAKFVSEEEVKKTLTYPSDQEAFEKILKLVNQ